MYVAFVDHEDATKFLHEETMDAVPSRGHILNLTGDPDELRYVENVVWGISGNGIMMAVVTSREL